MVSCQEFIELIDMFSESFSFTINKKLKNSTMFGGIITIFFFIFGIILFFIFSNDLFHKEHPIITSSTFESTNGYFLNGTDYNLTLIVSGESGNRPINLTGGLLTSSVVLQGQERDEDGEPQRIFKRYAPQDCQEEVLSENGLSGKGYLCFNFSDILVGKSLDGQEYGALVLQVSISKNIDLNLLKDYLSYKKSPIINLYYPKLIYNPNDYKAPVKIELSKNTIPLDFNILHIVLINFMKTIFNDDKGIAIPNTKNFTYWSVENQEILYRFRTSTNLDDITKIDTNILFQLQVMTENLMVYYTRRYQKLQEVLSIILSIFRVVFVFIEIIFRIFLIPIIRNTRLISVIFDYDKHSKIQLNKKIPSLTPTKKLIFSDIPLKKENMKIFINSNINIRENNSNLNIINNQERIINKNNFQNFLNNKITNRKERKISYCDYSCYKLNSYFSRKNKKNFNINNTHEVIKFCDYLIEEYFDLDKYIKIIYELEILKKCILPKELILMMNYFNKPNIYDKSEIDNLLEIKGTNKEEEDIQKIYDYLKEKEKEKLLLLDNNYFFNLLSNEIKKKIIFKYENINSIN